MTKQCEQIIIISVICNHYQQCNTKLHSQLLRTLYTSLVTREMNDDWQNNTPRFNGIDNARRVQFNTLHLYAATVLFAHNTAAQLRLHFMNSGTKLINLFHCDATNVDYMSSGVNSCAYLFQINEDIFENYHNFNYRPVEQCS